MTSRLLEEYHILNTIIEQDKRVSSFKYALLRGTIEICQQYAHLEKVEGEKVWYPLGLLIEKWIFYYYPIFESDIFIPQLNGEKELDQNRKNISFRKPLSVIINFYRTNGGGISEFFTDYRNATIPDLLQETMKDLIRTIRWAIIDGPFQHLGFSHYKSYYSVFDWDHKKLQLPKTTICPEYLLSHCGNFSLSNDLVMLFKYFGSFILGEGSILNKWADFTTQIGKAQGLSISKDQMLNVLGYYPDTQRQVQEISRFYHTMLHENGYISCVWSGYLIKSHDDLHIDHMLPFSLWKNNDLWNLLPARNIVNSKKKDAIPSPEFIIHQQNLICYYWEMVAKTYPGTFHREIAAALTGKDISQDD